MVISTPSTRLAGLAAPIAWAVGPICVMWPCSPSRSLASSLESMRSCTQSAGVMTGGSAWRTTAAKVSSEQGSLVPGKSQFWAGMIKGLHSNPACLPNSLSGWMDSCSPDLHLPTQGMQCQKLSAVGLALDGPHLAGTTQTGAGR